MTENLKTLTRQKAYSTAIDPKPYMAFLTIQLIAAKFSSSE